MVWERLTKVQSTTRPENVWPEVWTKIVTAAQKSEKRELGNERPKLDKARSLRGIYFIDPEDGANKIQRQGMHRGGSGIHETTFGLSTERS